MKHFFRILILHIFLIIVPASAQPPEIDVLQLLSTLEGEWQGQLILEKAKDVAEEIDYGMRARVSNDQALIQEHQFNFPQGPLSATEILTYDEASTTLLIAYFNGRKRFISDLTVTSASLGENNSWRILTEHEETYGETPVTIRNLYQLEGGLFTKFRWVKDGEDYILSDSVRLTRVKSP